VGLALMARSQIIQSFVARFWLEQTDDADPKWRGHIRHVQGCEETYFEHLEEMSDFMQQVSGIPGTEIVNDTDKLVTIGRRAGRKIKQEKNDD
jgi:hypothetical protein